MKKMPRQRRGQSRQDYGTPPIFIERVLARLNIPAFAYDLAASTENAVCPRYYTEAQDALKREHTWKFPDWAYLNPPFAHIEPWVAKALRESKTGARVAMLVPAAVGANWWREYVHRRCRVLFLNGRLTFVGETQCYPKDCALLLYGPSIQPGYEVWTWRQVKQAAA